MLTAVAMIDVLAFPNIVPFQVMLVASMALHIIATAVLTVRRGSPAWLGLTLGFIPVLGPLMAMMLAVDHEAAAADRQQKQNVERFAFSTGTMLLLMLATLVPVIRLFLRAQGETELSSMVDDKLGLWILLIVGLATALIVGAIARSARAQVVVTRATLLLAIAYVGLLLIERNVVRFDMTAEQRYSLDPAMRSVLQELPKRPETLSITYYYSPRSLRPHRLSRAPEEISDLLEEYRRVAPDSIRIELVEVPQKMTAAEARESDGGLVFGRSQAERERRKEQQTDDVRRRTELFELLERRSIEPVEETTQEGGKSVGFSYYSSFWVSYGQQPGDRINGLTVSRDDADEGKRVVDRAQYELTNMVRRMVRSSFRAAQPFHIKRFSADGKTVQLEGDKEFRPIGYAELKAATGIKYTITEIVPEQSLIRIVESGVDKAAEPAPEVDLANPQTKVIHYVPRVTHTVGFLTGHDEPTNQYESLRADIRSTDRFDWQYVDLQKGRSPVPDEVDVLVIGAVAGELTQREQYEIDQYLMRGGRVLAFAGPLTWTGGGGGMPGSQAFPRVHASWLEFVGRYGVRVGRDLIFDEQCLVWSFDRSGGSRVEVPAILKLHAALDHPVNSGLTFSKENDQNATLMIYPTTVDVNEEDLPRDAEGNLLVEAKDVLVSSPRAWLHPVPRGFHSEPFAWTDSMRSGYSEAIRAFRSKPEAADEFQQFSFAVSLAGTFHSGFTADSIPPRPKETITEMPPGFPPGFPGGGGRDGDGLQDPGDAQTRPASDGDGGDVPQTAPQTGPGPDVEPEPEPDPGPAFVATGTQPARMLVYGQSFAYPVNIPFGFNSQVIINGLDWLVGNDELLSLADRSSARRPIDPTLSQGTRNWFGWMVFLVVPLALVLVSFFLFVFGIQERWFLKARQQAGGNAATARPDDGLPRDREPGLLALVVGILLAGVLIVGWVNTSGFAGLWVAGLLLAGVLVARGIQILFEN